MLSERRHLTVLPSILAVLVLVLVLVMLSTPQCLRLDPCSSVALRLESTRGLS